MSRERNTVNRNDTRGPPDLIVALKTAHDTDLRHLVVSKGSPAVSGSGFLQLETTLKLHVSCAWVFRDLVGPVVDPFAPS